MPNRAIQAAGRAAEFVVVEEGAEGPLGAFETAVAQGAHVCLERGGLLICGASVAGGEEPIEFVFGEGAGEPAEQKVGGAGQRNLAERNAERKLKERCGCGRGQMAKEGPFDLATAG